MCGSPELSLLAKLAQVCKLLLVDYIPVLLSAKFRILYTVRTAVRAPAHSAGAVTRAWPLEVCLRQPPALCAA